MRSFIPAVIASVTLVFLAGCGNPAEEAVKPLFRPSPDKDFTAKAGYNFPPFAGTVWKTRTKTAIMKSKRYTGAWDIKLFIPERFDPAHPRYNPPVEAHIIAVLPPGTRLRISRLLHDEGAAGFLQVEAILLDGTNAQRAVLLDPLMLASNVFEGREQTTNRSWQVEPAMLEKP